MLCPRCKVEMRLADPPRCREGGVALLRLCCRNRQCAEYGTVRQVPEAASQEAGLNSAGRENDSQENSQENSQEAGQESGSPQASQANQEASPETAGQENTRADAPANTGAEAPANTTDKEETP